MVKLEYITGLIFEINRAIDHGKLLDYQVTADALLDQSWPTLYRNEVGKFFFDGTPEHDDRLKELAQLFADNAHAGRDEKRYGIANNGLNLLLAHCAEAIQEWYVSR